MTIDILGIPYEVIQTERVGRTEVLLGQIDFLTQTIRIDKSLPLERRQEVLIHEVLHGILEIIGLDEVLDEQATQMLGIALYNLLKSNPAIFSLTAFEKVQTPQQS